MYFKQVVILLFTVWIVIPSGFSQVSYAIHGKITDEKGVSLPGAAVLIKPLNKAILTDMNGQFSFLNLPTANYVLKVQYLGYADLVDSFYLNHNLQKNYQLITSVATLKEVVVIDHYAEDRKKDIPVSSDVVDGKYINKNLGNSLMNSLERLPGVDAINIGSGQAKPVIRGLSFNRVVVVENGITHEGQQWGADHGLEIDQFAVDRAEVIRGPASLIYGSDAIGGVIDLRQLYTPEQGTLSGDVNLIGKSNNNLIGGSASIGMAGKKMFFIFRTTWLDWADYKVPADFVDIYSFRMPLYRNSLRNTSGEELNFHLTTGYINRNFSSRFYISMVSSKSGFFANAHGLEPRNVDTVLHDANLRDVLNPYQSVKHYKIQNQSRWQWKKGFVEAVIGFQNNKRQEISDYVSHGYMPPVFPGELDFNPELERSFDKDIFSANAKVSYNPRNSLTFMSGLSFNFQDNQIGGRGFIIPEFQQLNSGIFLYAKKLVGEKGSLQGGLRYDVGRLTIDSYADWFQSAVIVGIDTSWQYLQRASNSEKTFGNVSWSLGYNYVSPKILFKINLGKSFR
ncbi:MAG: TonB-dependent receptor plug domain-containing protein, partial [Bacteroidales bacterium]|nr:TonB-dependent receptor plug domain-containing protein [Bacteroidales bacterium]